MNRIFALVLLFGTGFAQAEPLTWYLQDVTFADGGSASGSFDYDADSNTYSNVAVTSTGSGELAPTTYRFGMLTAEFTPSATSINLTVASQAAVKDNELMLTFDSALTNAGGSVAIATKGSLSKEGLCAEAPPPAYKTLSCYGGGLIDWMRAVSAGSVTTTPDLE